MSSPGVVRDEGDTGRRRSGHGALGCLHLKHANLWSTTKNNREEARNRFWSDFCKSGDLFNVSRKFCLENQKQLNKSLRTTSGDRNCSAGSQSHLLLFQLPSLEELRAGRSLLSPGVKTGDCDKQEDARWRPAVD